MEKFLVFAGIALIFWFAWWLSGKITNHHIIRLLDKTEKELLESGKFDAEELKKAKEEIIKNDLF